MQLARIKPSFPTYDYEKWQDMLAPDGWFRWAFQLNLPGKQVKIVRYINSARALVELPYGSKLEVSTKNLQFLKFKLRST